jgi:hypothetical protein
MEADKCFAYKHSFIYASQMVHAKYKIQNIKYMDKIAVINV